MKKQLFISLLSVFFFHNLSSSQIRLPKLISNNMVLQRDQPIKIWGWASPKEKITLIFNRKKALKPPQLKVENGK